MPDAQYTAAPAAAPAAAAPRPEKCTATTLDDLDMESPDECPNCLCPIIVLASSTPGSTTYGPADAPTSYGPLDAAPEADDSVHALLCPNCSRRTHSFTTPQAAMVAWQTQSILRCHCSRCREYAEKLQALVDATDDPEATRFDLLVHLGDPEMQHRKFEVV